MTEADTPSDPDPDPPARAPGRRPRRPRRRFQITAAVLSLPFALVILFAFAVLAFTGQPIPLPNWVADRIEAQASRAMGDGSVTVGSAELVISPEGEASVVLRNLALRDDSGATLGQVTEIGAGFTPLKLWQGTTTPERLRIAGAQITIRRGADGSFLLDLGGTATTQAETLAEVLDLVDAAFSTAPLSDIAEIAAEDVTITLEDARSGRVWQATNGLLTLRNGSERIEIDVLSEVFNGTEDLARVQMSFGTDRGGSRADLAVSVENAAAADIALQSPALTFLGVLDAPVSGAIRAVFGTDAELASLAATLDLGAGRLIPGGDERPVSFNRGRVYLEFDPASRRFTLSEVSVESDRLRLTGDGHAILGPLTGGLPDALTAQIAFSEVAIAQEGVFEAPLAFDGALADVRLNLDPFSVDIGQLALLEGDRRIGARGRIGAEEDGWTIALDVTADALTPERVLALWPVTAIPNTRNWLRDNLLSAEIGNFNAALRLAPGRLPRVGVTYDFTDAEVRVLRHFPTLRQARGRAALHGDAYTMFIDAGTMPTGFGPVGFDGSSIRISRIFTQPSRADIRLRTDSTLAAALALMNNRPFQVLTKADLAPDVAAARARVSGRIGFDLTTVVPADAVRYNARGTLSDMASDTLVPGRVLRADRLDLSITRDRIALSGPLTLDGYPAEARFVQPIGPGELAPARVAARFDLTPALLDTFGIGLPPGSLTGAAPAEMILRLPREAPPVFTLASTLEGAGLSLPPLGWSKAAGTAATLDVAGNFGPDPAITRLDLTAPGMTARGRVELAPGGGFVAADFDRVATAGWFDAPVRIEGRGQGVPPRIVLAGGEIDIRRAPDGGGGGAGGPVPVTVALDRLRITDGLALTDLRADLVSSGGFAGDFTARVNGGVSVAGTLVPSSGRTEIRAAGGDAGRALREAGLFRFARDGTFRLVLTPRPGGPGFDGALLIEDTRLNNQPVLMDLLDAVSIVGILDQLRGAGIIFDTVNARFRLLPGQVILDEGAAVGASLGISLDGIYDTRGQQLDMQGVVSPIYVLNSMGQFLTRRGEGLFGFTFTMTGPSDAPRIAVNPLSLLTPGMFREIFRRPPPQRTTPLPEGVPEAPAPESTIDRERPNAGGGGN